MNKSKGIILLKGENDDDNKNINHLNFTFLSNGDIEKQKSHVSNMEY